jgi:hypothetical protein
VAEGRGGWLSDCPLSRYRIFLALDTEQTLTHHQHRGIDELTTLFIIYIVGYKIRSFIISNIVGLSFIFVVRFFAIPSGTGTPIRCRSGQTLPVLFFKSDLQGHAIWKPPAWRF